jgi:hypothetical protein
LTAVIIRNMEQRMEQRSARRAKRQKIQDIVLAGLFLAGVAGVMATAPNALQLLRYVERYLGPQKRLDERIAQALCRLRAKGFITSGTKLSRRGTVRAESARAYLEARPTVPRRWDRKWRIVLFDVWEQRRAARNRLRSILEHAGFVKMQESVWVYPYPCEELFAFMRSHLRLGPGIRYVIADEIDNDAALRQAFSLPDAV